MSRKRKTNFYESALMNNGIFLQYFQRMSELAISMFEWKGFPESVDTRFLELTLFNEGQCVCFEDEVMGMLTLQNAMNGDFDMYRIPKKRRAYAVNGYNKNLTNKDSVIIYNNMLHTNTLPVVHMFAKRLWNLDRIIDVNANAQKTPILILCDENERLSMQNLYKEYDGNSPVICGERGLNTKGFQVLKTDAPFVADKIYTLKTQIWNEFLTYIGISNLNIEKKERLLTDEVTRNQGGTQASRYSRLTERQRACEKINAMFGTNVSVDFREDIQLVIDESQIGRVQGGDNNE